RRDRACCWRAVQRWIAVWVGLTALVRVPAAAIPGQYANFYLPIGVVMAVHLFADLIPGRVSRFHGSGAMARVVTLSLLSALAVVIAEQRSSQWAERQVEFRTPRGTLRLPEQDAWLPAYRGAMDSILTEVPPHRTILAVPTEPALYFFTDRGNHLHDVGLVAAVLSKSAERAYIAELERDPPCLVLTSNR